MNLLTLDSIKLSFDQRVILDEVSLEAKSGDIIGLVAPNGTGKSTLLNIIMNRLRPQGGKVIIKDGLQYTSERKKVHIYQHLSMMTDQHDLYEELSGLDHLKLYKGIWKNSEMSVEQLVLDLDMGHYIKQKVGQYSLGMRQRLCFAMQLVTDTDIMLMDEVMNGLDPHNVELISYMMVREAKKGKLIIIASHLLENLEQYADRIFFLQHGKLEEYGTMSPLGSPETRYIKITKEGWEVPADWPKGYQIDDSTFLTPIKNDSQLLMMFNLLQSANISHYTVGKLSLMDHYKIKFNL